MGSSFRLGDLAARIGGQVIGNADRQVRGVATLENATEDDLAFLTNPKYRDAAAATRAGALLVGRGTRLAGRDMVEVAEPYVALAQVLEWFHPPKQPRPGVSSDARLGQDVEIGEDAHVGPFAVIGDGCAIGARVVIGAGTVIGDGTSIGDDTVVMPRVVIYRDTRVGARCIIHAGVVLGADGFGFATSGGVHRKVPQVGRVVIEDDVEIGANSAVDRGAIGDTVIGQGTKIDDLVMVAHGVQVGPGCLLVAQSGIAGSTRLGAQVTFAGQAGAAGHLEIGERTVVAAKSAVFADVPAGSFVAGIPAGDHRAWKRAQAVFQRLPDLRHEIMELRRRVALLEADRVEER